MRQMFHRAHKKAAQMPGTVEYAGPRRMEKAVVRCIDYDADNLVERKGSVKEFFDYRDTPSVTWINVDGLHETDIVQELGTHYGLHALVLEDVVNNHQRPKIEDHTEYVYIVCRMLRYDPEQKHVISEQLSLVLGKHYVLSFQEVTGDVFEPVRDRIRHARGRIRKMGADYLAYALLDAIVDNYFGVLETLGERIEELEENIGDDPSPEALQEIHVLKREMIYLRKAVWPLREVVSSFERAESSLVRESTIVFVRDLYDHTLQVMEAVDSFRDMLSSMQDLYMSSISNRMNEVMKVLTIIATIFVPLTFVAGIYGMNFEHMPELKWRWSYLIFWGVITTIALCMLRYFRNKRWL